MIFRYFSCNDYLVSSPGKMDAASVSEAELRPRERPLLVSALALKYSLRRLGAEQRGSPWAELLSCSI